MPKVAEKYKEERRAHILKSAKALFAKNGFHKTTMRDIQKQSGLSSGAVYGYFKSKEDIIEAIAMQTIQQNVATIKSSETRPDFASKLGALGDHFFGAVESSRKNFISVDIELWGEAQRNRKVKKILAQSMMAHLDAFCALIEKARVKGEVRASVDSEYAAAAMIGVMHGLMVQMKIRQDVSVKRYSDVIRKMFDQYFFERGKQEP